MLTNVPVQWEMLITGRLCIRGMGRGYTVQKHTCKANQKAIKKREKAASGIQMPELFQVMPEGLGIARDIGAWASSLSSFPGTVKAPECGR